VVKWGERKAHFIRRLNFWKKNRRALEGSYRKKGRGGFRDAYKYLLLSSDDFWKREREINYNAVEYYESYIIVFLYRGTVRGLTMTEGVGKTNGGTWLGEGKRMGCERCVILRGRVRECQEYQGSECLLQGGEKELIRAGFPIKKGSELRFPEWGEKVGTGRSRETLWD